MKNITDMELNYCIHVWNAIAPQITVASAEEWAFHVGESCCGPRIVISSLRELDVSLSNSEQFSNRYPSQNI